jgi:hypothetical protein
VETEEEAGGRSETSPPMGEGTRIVVCSTGMLPVPSLLQGANEKETNV